MLKHFSSLVVVLVLSGSAFAANPNTSQLLTASTAGQQATHQPQQSFSSWRAALRSDALQQGISPQLFEQAFAGLTPDPEVLAADQSQPEFSRPVWEYLDSAVSSWRVARGKALLAEHARTLSAIEARYQVDPSILVAVWGMESSFGRHTGNKNVIRSLATLAYEGRRNEFWRTQLIAALQILQEGDISISDMQGSWAGAMGPSLFPAPTANMQWILMAMAAVIFGIPVLMRWPLRPIICTHPAGSISSLGGLLCNCLAKVLIMHWPMDNRIKPSSNGVPLVSAAATPLTWTI
jgi:membrane-bound lytic murein transglycosylase B